MGGIESIKINVTHKHVKFKFDAKKHSIQELMKVIEGESGRFSARLLLQIKSKRIDDADFLKLKASLLKIKGIRDVRQPDENRIIMITLKKEQKTLLPELLECANKIAIPLQDPKVETFFASETQSSKITKAVNK